MKYLDGGDSVLGSYWEPIIAGAKKFADCFQPIIALYEQNKDAIQAFIEYMWGFIQFVFSSIVSFLQSNSETVFNIFSALIGAISSAIQFVTDILILLLACLLGESQVAEAAMRDIWEGFLGFFQSIGDLIINIFLLMGAALYALFAETVDGIVAEIADLPTNFSYHLDELVTAAKEKLELVKNTFRNAVEVIKSIFAPVGNLLEKAGRLIGMGGGGGASGGPQSTSSPTVPKPANGWVSGFTNSLAGAGASNSSYVFNISGNDQFSIADAIGAMLENRDQKSAYNNGSNIRF